MVPEPTGSAAQSAVAEISTMILVWTGITFFSMLWSFIGVIAALVFIAPSDEDGETSNARAIASVLIATMVGAGLAELVYSMMLSASVISKDGSAGVKLGMALILGAAAKPALIAGVERFVTFIKGKREAA